MALKKSGILLVAEGDQAFFAVMARAGQTVVEFGQTSDKAGAEIAALSQRITRLTDTIGLQNRQLSIAERQLNETVAAHGADSVAAQKQQLSIDKLSASIRNNESTLNRLQNELGQVENAQEKAAKGATRLGDVMTGALREVGAMAVNLAGDMLRLAGQGIAAAVDMAGDYEQSMNVLQAQSGATDAQMEQLRSTAVALGADLTLPATSAVDAGQAMLELSKGGLEVEQAMDAAKGTLQLAAAAETDVATAAQITTGALSAFGLEGEQAGHVADVLTNAANESRASITDLGAGLQQAGFRFHSAGQGVDDLAASLVVLTNAGSSGSDAGTALSNMIARLQAPTDKAAKLMHQLGINVYDAQGNMLPMRDIIGVMNTALGGMTQQQRNAALQTIFLTDGMKAMIPLLAQGAEGFDTIKETMNRQGAAARLAEAQMQGVKGAAAGLQSQVETLALEGLTPLLPIMASVLRSSAALAGSFVGTVGPAVESLIGFFQATGEIVNTLFLPAVSAAGAALLLYAVSSIPAALSALPLLVTQVTAAAAAFTAQAAAVALAALPFVALAAAIGVATLKYQQLSKMEQDATQAMLAGKEFWVDSTDALENYGDASAETQARLGPLADSIRMQRTMLEENIQSLARRKEMGLVTEEQFAAEMDQLNGLATAIDFASKELDKQTGAELATARAAMTATEQAGAMTDAHDELTGAVELTGEEIEALGKTLEKVYRDGTKAVETYVSAAISFEAELTKAIKEGNEEQAKSVAANYAEQAAAARASIGEQLSAYTIAQMQLGNISRDQAGTILTAIEKEFGTTQSIAASTFLAMEQSIDEFATNGGSSADALGGKLDSLAQDAIETKAKMDALATQYEAELVENFREGKLNAEELRSELEKIPERVYSEVHITTYKKTVESSTSATGGTGSAATGGVMKKGETFLVGEKGPEMFTAGANGYVTPNNRMAPPASPSQIIMPQPQIIMVQPANTTNYNGQVGNNYTQRGGGSGLGFDHLASIYGGRG